MTDTAMQDHSGDGPPPLVGDHLALDLLNTTARDDGHAIEYWHSGDAVLDWLASQGIAPETARGIDRAQLLAQALALRALARQLIAQRKDGAPVDLEDLNGYLHAHLSAPRLQYDEAGALALVRIPRGDPIAALLGPVAEAVAQLLADGDFALVRQCEHPDCILWFYDRTKAHKRRWCSMAVCGNRHKAAQFRKRGGGAPSADVA